MQCSIQGFLKVCKAKVDFICSRHAHWVEDTLRGTFFHGDDLPRSCAAQESQGSILIHQIHHPQLGCWERAWRMGRDGQRLGSQQHLLKGDPGGSVSVNLCLFPTRGGEGGEERQFQQGFYQQLAASN